MAIGIQSLRKRRLLQQSNPSSKSGVWRGTDGCRPRGLCLLTPEQWHPASLGVAVHRGTATTTALSLVPTCSVCSRRCLLPSLLATGSSSAPSIHTHRQAQAFSVVPVLVTPGFTPPAHPTLNSGLAARWSSHTHATGALSASSAPCLGDSSPLLAVTLAKASFSYPTSDPSGTPSA